ncbi:nuclear factor 7, ovary-like [Aulostomus maculatus]
MASSSYTDDLTCSICLTIFTDPVVLPCGHSFCRECVALSLESQHQCPECRAAVPTEGTYLLNSHILKSLAEKAKENETLKRANASDKEVVDLCPEHEEKLKLFCVTDQQLTCTICRDGERHEGHKFKPIREAAASLTQQLRAFLESVSADSSMAESRGNTQREEIKNTKQKSDQLMEQIHSQFETMHQFLRKREDEIKKELICKELDDFDRMNEVLNDVETIVSESSELAEKVKSVLEITDSEQILKSWAADEPTVASMKSFRLRGSTVNVVNTSLSLGPYESHLQFFMWKELLQVIEPREEQCCFQTESKDITVSKDGKSLFCTPSSSKTPISKTFGQTSSGFLSTGFAFGSSALSFENTDPYGAPLSSVSATTFSTPTYHGLARSVDEFTSGEHYWEIEVGRRKFWELGIKDHFLKYDGQNFAACCPEEMTTLTITEIPRKIGIYLNFSTKKLSFYDAANMTHIHTLSTPLTSEPVSAHVNISYQSGEPEWNPLSLCRY